MKYLISPAEYSLPNPRIDGWKKLHEVKARAVDIYVFPLEVFSEFRKTKKLPAGFITEAEKVAKQIIDASPSHAALVRRAFVVPGLENPPGPRFLGLTTPEMVVDAIKQLFVFAIDQKYDEKSDSQISSWIEPPSTVLDIEQFNKDASFMQIPYGGYAVSVNGFVEAYAVFGINEGVQSLVADHYLVEFRRGRPFVLKKDVPQKNLMLCTTRTEGKKTLQVPLDMQFDQILSDAEITEVARVVSDLSQKYGPQRVEFSTDEGGICFNEVADFWEKEKNNDGRNINIRGTVRLVDSLDSFRELVKTPAEDLASGKVIIKIDEKIISNRDYDVLGAIAAWKDHFFVLYPGVAATQHAMRVLTDKGHKAFLVGNQKFSDGDEAQIIVSGGKVRVTNLSHVESKLVVSLWDAALLGVELCGGKADRLSKMKIAGYQVPHGVVLTTKFFDKRDKHQVQELIPDYVNGDRKFAIRSSATIEDDSKDSMAGMFDTFLGITGKELSTRVDDVIQSAFAPKVTKYLEDNPAKKAILKMAVVVQEMVDARCAGVVFGAKAQTGNLNVVEIEAKVGLGEDIVSGEAAVVEQVKFSRSDRRVIERKGPEVLSQVEQKALFMLSERLRAEFGDTPQDVEWAIDNSGQIWVLQSRDLYLGK